MSEKRNGGSNWLLAARSVLRLQLDEELDELEDAEVEVLEELEEDDASLRRCLHMGSGPLKTQTS